MARKLQVTTGIIFLTQVTNIPIYSYISSWILKSFCSDQLKYRSSHRTIYLLAFFITFTEKKNISLNSRQDIKNQELAEV